MMVAMELDDVVRDRVGPLQWDTDSRGEREAGRPWR